MRILPSLFLAITFIFVSGCGESENTILSGCKKYFEIEYSDFVEKKNDPLLIIDGKIKDDCLKLTLQYGGGCEDHQVDLVYLKNDIRLPQNSFPLFELLHDAKKDFCKALITKDYSFDISGLRIKGKSKTDFYIGSYKAGKYTQTLYSYTY